MLITILFYTGGGEDAGEGCLKEVILSPGGLSRETVSWAVSLRR